MHWLDLLTSTHIRRSYDQICLRNGYILWLDDISSQTWQVGGKSLARAGSTPGSASKQYTTISTKETGIESELERVFKARMNYVYTDILIREVETILDKE